ncbi:MAG: glycosyltransferase, partial [Gemmatimonadetes bacterium]|nr:glycosyltransferase [Gemmatimonadota bacterium]
MRTWLITVGEPLPLPGQRTRLLRTGRLALALVRRGHQVTWWTSTFDHFAKAGLDVDDVERLSAGLELRFLHGIPYDRNVSVRRLVNHWQLARGFRRRALEIAPPDVILCSFPTVELCWQATRYARRKGVPILIDVRDLWPDIFLSAMPGPLRWAGRMALRPMLQQARHA